MSTHHQRAQGSIHLTFKRRGPATVLDELRQDGALKVRIPCVEPGSPMLAITLNITGGVAGGDRHDLCVATAPGTDATVASQAAERIYGALPGQTARIATALHVADAASLEWLPQETILFDRCALHRTLDIHLAAGARFTGVENLVFGRGAMGEAVHSARLFDRIAVHRGGDLLLHDATRFDGPVAALLDRRAVAKGGRAVSTLLHASPDAADRLAPLRDALAPWDAGASLLDGLLMARIVAGDGAVLRRAVTAALHVLRAGRTLPRTWFC